MNILFLSQRFLFPMDTGGKIRTGKILEKLNHDFDLNVTMISNVESPKDDPYLPQVKKLCHEFIAVPWREVKKYSLGFYLKLAVGSLSKYPISVLNDYSKEMEHTVLKELNSKGYELAICDFLQSALNFRNLPNVATILFQHNVETIIARRHFETVRNPLDKFFWWLQHRKMFRFERAMTQRFDGIIAVSDKDKQFMEKMFGAKNVHTIPTGVDTDYYYPVVDVKEKEQLVFTGSMDWLPNEDAMIYFIDKIFPIVKSEVPEAKLIVVGRNPNSRFLDKIKNRIDIEVTGWVDDTRPYIAASAVFVVPIRIGGGTRMKIYEAMAMGKPVVSTSVGAEGLPLRNGEHLIIEDEETRFADQVIQLLRDSQLRSKIGKGARQFVQQNFGWEKVAKVFSEICQEVYFERNRQFVQQRKI